MSAQSSAVRVWLATLAILPSGAAICPSVCLAGKPNQPPPPPVQYAVTVVPQMRCVTGMNNVGDMTGGPSSNTAGTLLYTAQTGTVIDLSTIIQVPDDGKLEYVVNVNDPDVDGRQVAGRFSRRELDGTNRYHAFRCTIHYDASNNLKSDAFEELVGPAEFPWSHAEAINNLGDVVGNLENDGGSQWRAFRWTASEDLDLFLPGVTGSARDINDAGQVTGSMYVGSQLHAFLYTPGSGVDDLNTLSRRNVSIGLGIGSQGQVAGYAYDPRPQVAFRYTDELGTVSLGTLSGDYWSEARAINGKGQVVGTSTNLKRVSRSFLYTDANTMLDLGALIVNPAGLDLASIRPECINDCAGYNFGQIAGTATVAGVPAVVVLTPDR